METILIIEDDFALMRGLADNCRFAGYNVETATDGESGLKAALDLRPDLILLDIMLPKVNGYEICRLVRKEKLDMPIIMLTAKGEESDIILGLNLGADDYVTKPFSIKQLLARIDAFLRRRRIAEPQSYEFCGYTLDTVSCKLSKDGQTIELSPKEYRLLEYFVKRRGRALTRDQILNAVWGYNALAGHRSVDRFVTTLRGKIESNPHQPTYIHTLREIGYMFEPQ
ncbi:MAG: response regulator transcription factor [Sedimentisphaerales bacterium]|nr:response regulator transcription factor [Sedimentisphaerales bacterium]MBN2843558.1 response regulator transcription factor [Sedimentisphaerales bacterium]